MRRAALAAVLLTAALVVQLTVVTRLRLPGGGAPDLVLLAVIALALCGGPVTGMLAGFCAGLALDIAPPASQLIGQYALVFCVAGYACGKLRGALDRSALLSVLIAAGAAAAGETAAAGLGLVLDPARVSVASVRHVLPPSVLYDVALSCLVLVPVVAVSRWVSGDRAGALRGPGRGSRHPAPRPGGGQMPPGRRQAAARRSRRGVLAAGHADGWIGGRPPGWRGPQAGAPARELRPRRRRRSPGSGTAGSPARGYARPARPGRAVSLRLAAGHRRASLVPGRQPRRPRAGLPRITFSAGPRGGPVPSLRAAGRRRGSSARRRAGGAVAGGRR